MIVKRPARPEKIKRTGIPRLDQIQAEDAIHVAIALRDKQWAEAIRKAGGGLV